MSDCEHPNRVWRAMNVEHYHCPDCNRNWTPAGGQESGHEGRYHGPLPPLRRPLAMEDEE